ncbi:hypothetical protein BST61_g4985 [Cercospora zeina]
MRLLGSQSRALLFRRAFTRPAGRPFSDRPFQPDDRVLLRNKNDRSAPPILTRPLRPGRRVESHRGTVLHDEIIGRKVRDVVQAQTPRSTRGSVGAEYRLHHVTLDEYCRLTRRLVTPIYPSDANLIVSLLDLHPSPHQDERIEILEAGTGHGSLTLHLGRALRGSHAGLHTIEVSPKFSAHAQEVVKGFRGGIYAENTHFHVGDVSDWVRTEHASRQSGGEPFLAHAFLDLPNAESHLQTIADATKTDGSVIVFNPSITQIIQCATKVKDDGIPLDLETVIELGLNGSSGGREWDVRFVRPRAMLKKNLEQDSEDVPPANESPSELDDGDSDVSTRAPVEDTGNTNKRSLVCRPKLHSNRGSMHGGTAMSAKKPNKRRYAKGMPPAGDSNTYSTAATSRSSPRPHYQTRSKMRSESRRELIGFLGLPAELRNNVYDMSLEDFPCIKLRSNQQVISACPLARVSKQLRNEFMSRALYYAPVLKTVVSKFQFAHVVTFLNHFNDKGLQTFEPGRDRTSLRGRSFVIGLDFNTKNDGVEIEANTDELLRWLKRFEHPDKKGTLIDFTYVKTNPEHVKAAARDHLFLRMALRAVWAYAGRWHEVGILKFGPKINEARKMWEALD